MRLRRPRKLTPDGEPAKSETSCREDGACSRPQRREPVAEHEVVAGDHAALERDALALAPHLGADGVAGKDRSREPRLDAFEPLRPVVRALAQDRARRDTEASRTMQDGSIEARGLGA